MDDCLDDCLDDYFDIEFILLDVWFLRPLLMSLWAISIGVVDWDLLSSPLHLSLAETLDYYLLYLKSYNVLYLSYCLQLPS